MEALLLRRGLIRRLEELETRFVPETTETRVLEVGYVDNKGNVVETLTYTFRVPSARANERWTRLPPRRVQLAADGI
jgi:hypothetical protein